MPLLSRVSSKTSRKDAQITDVNARDTTVLLTGENATPSWVSDESSSYTGKTSVALTGSPRAAKQNPYQPSGSYSTYFDGSSSLSLTVPRIFTAFTIEMWLYLPLRAQFVNSNPYLYTGSAATSGPLITINSNFGWSIGNRSTFGVTSANNIVPTGRWFHVAVVRTDTGTTGTKIYQDGVLVATGQITTASFSSGTANIGATDVGTQYFTGYISNFRLVNSAIYTDTFTPPTRPFNSNIPSVSGTNIASVPENSPKVVSFNGFDQNLSVTTNSTIDLATSAPDWTIECWFYTTTNGTQRSIIQKDGISGSRQPQYSIMIQTDNQINLTLSPASGGSGNQNFIGGSISTNTWYHVAAVRNGSNITVFLNGAIIAGPTALSITMGNNSGDLTIANNTGPADYFPGYIYNLRIVKGQALFSGTFTPSSTLLTNTTVGHSGANVATSLTGTVALLTCQGSTIIDNSPNNFTITATNSPTVIVSSLSGASTILLACSDNRFIEKASNLVFTLESIPVVTQFIPTQFINFTEPYNKYGSAFIDNANYFALSAPIWSTLTQVFTVEAWFYFTTLPALNNSIMGVVSNNGFMLYSQDITGNWVVNKYGVGDILTTSTAITIGKWTHVAVTRNSSNLMTMWIDGVSAGTATVAYNFSLGDWQIGNKGTGDISGYVSDFRVVTGTAVYTTAFTPPTTPLSAIPGTNLLTFRYNTPASNNTFYDGSAINQRIERNGTPSQGSYNPFGDNWSHYFGGFDYVKYPHLEQYNIYGFDTLIEFWINPSQGDSTSRGLINHADALTYFTGWQIRILNNRITIDTGDGSAIVAGIRFTANAETPVGVWSFIRIVKTSYELWTVYQNGVNIGSVQHVNGSYNVTNTLDIGLNRVTDVPFIGYLTNLRIVKGYTVNVDQPFNTPVTYFNGLTYAANTNTTALAFGTAPYTVELWMYNRGGTQGEHDIVEGNPAAGNWQLYFQTGSGGLKVGEYGGSAITIATPAESAAFFGNTWGHIAISRVASNLTNVYINGDLRASATDTTNYTSTGLGIGGRNTGTQYFTGVISNVRAIKGTALYTSDFEPQRRPLNAKQIPLDTRKNPNRSYSVKFNGTNDYLTLAASATEYQLNALDFTVECWVYINTTSTASVKRIFSNWGGPVGSYQFYLSASNRAVWQLYTDNAPDIAALAITPFVWTHIAWCRRNGFVNTFINGILADSSSVTQSTGGTLTNPLIGGTPADGGNYFPGYISNFRLVKGTALYTSNFIPPTALTADVAGTSLLLCQSSSFIDNSTANAGIGFGVATNGTPSISNKFPYTFGDVVPAVSSGTSLLAMQNATLIDNSTAGNITFSVSASNPPKPTQILDLPAVPTYSFLPIDPKIPAANISLLTAMTNRVGIDLSYYKNTPTLTNSGNILVSKFNPLQPSVSVPATYSYVADGSNIIRFQANAINTSYQNGLPATWEWWMWQTSGIGRDSEIFGGTGTSALIWRITAAGELRGVDPGYNNFITVTVPNKGNVWVNNWCHVAVTAYPNPSTNQSVWEVYINGANLTSSATSYAGTLGWNNDSLNILGASAGSPSTNFIGYLSNFRYTRSRLYEPNVSFTPSIEPLQLTGDTLMLTAQDPVLIAKSDTYSLVAPFEVKGRVLPSTFNPFGYKQIPTSSIYDANAYGGSSYFNGNASYLTVNESQSQRLSNAFTIQGWFNATSKVAGNIVIASKGTVNTGWEIGIGRANTLLFTNATSALATVTPIRFNEWNHFAITRDVGYNVKLFLNGNLEVSGTLTNPYSQTSNIKIGSGRVAGANVFTGYIAGLQIDTGIAYANNFITPYFAQRPGANTVFYLESAPAVIDYSGKTNFETIGSTYMVKPFSDPYAFGLNNSVYFNAATSDYYQVADTTSLRLQSGDFTVEGYMYPVSVGSAQRGIFGKGTSTTGVELRIGGAVNKGLDFSYAATDVTNSWIVTQNTWHHFALTRGANVWRAFLDGVQVSSATANVNLGQTNSLNVGDGRVPGASFDGYISNFRIVTGTALYTANFNLPPTPLTAITNTKLLTFNGLGGNVNSANSSPIAAGVIPIGAGSPKVINYNPNVASNIYSSFSPVNTSLFFDGTGYIRSATAPNVSHLIYGNTAPFTFEANIYPLAESANLSLFTLGTEGPNRYTVFLSNGYLNAHMYGLATSNVGFPKVQPNTWTHVMVTRSSNVFYYHINGVNVLASSLAGNTLGTGQLFIGANGSGAAQFKGWMKDVRLSSVARANTSIPNRIIPGAPAGYNNIQPPPILKPNVDYVIVAGGGGGGTNAGSGGGAGGLLQGSLTLVPRVNYIITIGGGGAGAPPAGNTVNGSNGGNTTVFGFTVFGGGAGGTGTVAGYSGGSGGGSPSQAPSPSIQGGWYPGVDGTNLWKRGQGYPGGQSGSGTGASRQTGGGGGAANAGYQNAGLGSGVGGQGAPILLTGSNIFLAGGGGGGHHNNLGGPGGLGGGGAGGDGPGSPSVTGNAGIVGTVNTGGGGGGGSGYSGLGAAGGSGIVILRHPTAYGVATTTGTVLITATTTNVVYQFYSSGTIQLP